MARVCKSLKAPEQGYPHREHRSAKHRKPISRIDRRKKVIFENRIQREKDKHIQEEVEQYCSEMEFLRRQWNFKEKVL